MCIYIYKHLQFFNDICMMHLSVCVESVFRSLLNRLEILGVGKHQSGQLFNHNSEAETLNS